MLAGTGPGVSATEGPVSGEVPGARAAPESVRPPVVAMPGHASPTVNDMLFLALRRVLAPLRHAPWWLKVTLVYAAARVTSFVIFAAAAWQSDATPWYGQQPGYLEFIDSWDAGWYEKIFNQGYPSVIPRNADGSAQPNEWAFYPVLPLLARGVHSVTGMGWAGSGALVATLAGFAAALVVHQLFRHYAGPATALWGVAFFAFFPVSAVLQVPYAESLGILFLAAALLLLIRGNYWGAVPLVILLCLSRPAGVPFAAVVLLHLFLRWRNRGAVPFPWTQRLAGAVLLAVSAIMAFAWMLVAWWVTGDRSTYTDTETSWRGTGLVLFKPWFEVGVQLAGPFWGPLLPVLFAALAGLYLSSRAVRRIGPELRVWCAMYLLYLLAVLHPQSSTFRMLLPLFPLALAAAFISRSRAYRWAVLVMFTVLQVVWVVWLWQFAAISRGVGWPP